MAQNAVLSKTSRLNRAFELKMRGMSDAEISKTMKGEGFKHVSRRTISRLMTSVEATRKIEELERLQLRDIAIADLPLRLKYRGKLLDKLMPRKSMRRP
jgi:orotate phosphoribosyltransferase-like protein